MQKNESTPRTDLADAWYSALRSPVGVAVYAVPRESIISKMNDVRRELADPALSELQIVRPVHTDTEIWILHKKDVP